MGDSQWHHAMQNAIRDTRFEVWGHEGLDDEAVALIVTGLLRAFKSDAGLLYVEPYPVKGTDRPPDLLFVTPETGALSIEVKGHEIERIQAVRNGAVTVRYQGYQREKNAVQQARNAMFEMKAVIGRVIDPRRGAADRLAALFSPRDDDPMGREGFRRLPG